MRAWLVDPLPNSLNKHSDNDMVDSKENIKQYLGSENIKDNFYIFLVMSNVCRIAGNFILSFFTTLHFLTGWKFFRLFFFFFKSSVLYCKDHSHIYLFIYSSNIGYS